MQATLPGLNRTGATASPEGTQAMTDAVNELMPPVPIDTAGLEAERLLYIDASETVGSIPPPLGVDGCRPRRWAARRCWRSGCCRRGWSATPR